MLGGFIFWNVDSFALDFYSEGELGYGDLLVFEDGIRGETIVLKLDVINSEEEPVLVSGVEIVCSKVGDVEEDSNGEEEIEKRSEVEEDVYWVAVENEDVFEGEGIEENEGKSVEEEIAEENGGIEISGAVVEELSEENLEEGENVVVDENVGENENAEMMESEVMEEDEGVVVIEGENIEQDISFGCDYVSTDFESGVFYFEDSREISLFFSAEESGHYEGSVNFLTGEGIMSFDFVASVYESGKIEDVGENLIGESFIDKIISFLNGKLTKEDFEKGVGLMKKEKKPIKIVRNDVGITESVLNFGELEIGEQKTIVVDFENLVDEWLDVSGLKDTSGLIAIFNKKFVGKGERFTASFTCAPLKENMVVAGETGAIVETNRGEIMLDVDCVGVRKSAFEKALDEVAPSVSIIHPLGGRINGVVKIVADVFDERGVANVKVYVGTRLMKVLNKEPYEFDFNTYKVDNGLRGIFVVAIDDSGNRGVGEVYVVVANEIIGEDDGINLKSGEVDMLRNVDFENVPERYHIEYDVGEGYNLLDKKEGVEKIEFVEGDVVDFKLRIDSFGKEIPIEINDVIISDSLKLDLGRIEAEMIKRDVGGVEADAYNWEKEDLLYLMDVLNVDEVGLPVKLQGYEEGKDITMRYYYDEGGDVDISELVKGKITRFENGEEDIFIVTVPRNIVEGSD